MNPEITLATSPSSESSPKPSSRLTQLTIYPWIVWGLGAAFFFFEYIARVSPGVMVADLMRAFKVNGFALGGLSASFYYAYVGLQMPVGMLVDRFGVQRLLTAMSLLTAVGCALFASATNLVTAEIGRFLMGFGAAFAFVSTLKLVSIWFKPTQVGFLSGLTQALGMFGAAVGAAPVALLVMYMGWRNSIWTMAAIFVVLAFFIALLVRDCKARRAQIASAQTDNMGIFHRLMHVLSNPQTWFNAVYAGLLYAPTAAFAELWGTNFFERTYNLPNHIAASAVGAIFIGWGIGGPLMGWFSDYLGRRRPILIGSALTGCILMSIVIFVPGLPVAALFTLLFLYGVSNTGLGVSYALATEVNPRSMAGTALGFTNMASVIVGALFQPLIGRILDLQGDATFVNGVVYYSANSYRLAMVILPICLALSIVLALFVRETYCHSVAEN